MVAMMYYVYVQQMGNLRLEMLMAADGRHIGEHVSCIDGFYDVLCLAIGISSIIPIDAPASPPSSHLLTYFRPYEK